MNEGDDNDMAGDATKSASDRRGKATSDGDQLMRDYGDNEVTFP